MIHISSGSFDAERVAVRVYFRTHVPQSAALTSLVASKAGERLIMRPRKMTKP